MVTELIKKMEAKKAKGSRYLMRSLENLINEES